MEVEPSKSAAQRTYGRKERAAAETSIETGASSSPSRLFESSPGMDRDKGTRKAVDRSCNTTVSSDDEEGEGEQVDVIAGKHGRHENALLFLGDDDDADDEQGATAGKESDADFLKRFRESRAAKVAAGQDGHLAGGQDSATLVSSDLSEPPSLTNSSLPPSSHPVALASLEALKGKGHGEHGDAQASDSDSISEPSSPSPRKKRLAPLSGSLLSSSQSRSSATPSPYVTEAQKQEEERSKRTIQQARVKELAAKRGKSIGRLDNEEEEGDNVESAASDIQEAEEADLPSALKAAQAASDKGRRANERVEAERKAKKASKKGRGERGNGNVLQMRGEDGESDSDLEFNSKPHSREQTKATERAMSKKEEEQMRKTQARVERELKANQARAFRHRGEKQTFGLSDLLSNIDEHESARIGQQRASARDDGEAAHSSNSDPIESASDDEANGGCTRAVELSSLHARKPPHRSNRFNPVLKELSPSRGDQDGSDEELPDVASLRKSIIDEREKKEKLAAWRERKERMVLQAMKGQAEIEQDEDEVVLVDSRGGRGQSATRMMSPIDHRQRRFNRRGSPAGTGSDSGSDDDMVTDGQIRLAGKAFAPAVVEAAPSARKGRQHTTKERELTTEELNDAIIKRARLQNIEARRKREEASGRKREAKKADDGEGPGQENVADMIRKMKEAHESRREEESEQGSSGSEYDPEGGEQEEQAIDLGSGEEDMMEEEEEASDGASDDVNDDSEKENSAPASQESVQQPRLTRRPHVAVEDDELDGEGEKAGGKGQARESQVGSQERSPLQPIVLVEDGDDMGGEGAPPSSAFMPSSDPGFSQFFQETQVPNRAAPEQTASSPAPRNVSSTLGQFFEDTQADESLRGESFTVLDRAHSPGLSHFFNEGTQTPGQERGRLMGPPSTSANGLSLLGGADQDGFAALRRAQECQGRLLNFDADQLPSLDEVGGLREGDVAALELEALQAEMEERQRREKEKREEANVTYINKDGFFTQTKPEVERFSFSQTQSERGGWDDRGAVESSLDSRPDGKRRRMQRAESIEDDGQDSETHFDQPSLPDGLIRAKRVVLEDDDDEEQQQADSLGGARNAFDVIKGAMASRPAKAVHPPAKSERNRFVQGEAEESDEDEEGQAGRGGLAGIFSDEEAGSGSEEEDDDEGGEVEGLIDEERDEEEAEKDELARKRYLKDVEADDQAAMAMHERATRGGMRSKRRAVNMDGGLEGFLDDDYEDEWLERKAKNPYGNVAKKRKLKGMDGLDLLDARQESQAFVRQYREANERHEDLNKYDFLMPAEGEEGEEGEGLAAEEESSDGEGPQTVSHQELKRELEERRRRQRRQAVELSDDDDADVGEEGNEEEEAKARAREEEEERQMMKRVQRSIYGHSSEEEEEEEESRIVWNKRTRAGLAPLARNAALDKDDEAFSPLARVSNVAALTEREKQRLAQLQSEFANEPDWGSEDHHRNVASKRKTSSTGGSVTSFGSGPHRTTRAAKEGSEGRRGAPMSSTSSTATSAHRCRSRLGKVMSRRDLFSESLE